MVLGCALCSLVCVLYNLVYDFWCFRTELCRFSGAKIYPGRGIRFIRSDSQVSYVMGLLGFVTVTNSSCFIACVSLFGFFIYFWLIRYIYTKICSLVWLLKVFLFVNSKCKRYFHNRLKPSKLTWTAMYRKQHKKVIWC